jgi:hypothetical protein
MGLVTRFANEFKAIRGIALCRNGMQLHELEVIGPEQREVRALDLD